jgi:hypothetical protein
MYASIRRYQVDPEQMDDLMTRVDRGFAEILSNEPGFCSYQAIDAGDGVCITVTCFRQEEDAHRSADMAASWVGDALSDLDVERIGAEAGAVQVSRAVSDVLEPAHH